jgi:hypothetical protein
MGLAQQTQILEEKQPRQIPKTLLDFNLCDTHGYKQLLRCKKCGAKFRSVQQMREHYRRKHVNFKLRYSRILVTEKYIAAQIANCKTKEIVFGHMPKTDNDCEYTKKVLNSCYIRVCPKCEATRRLRYKRKYEDALQSFNRVSVLTLTYRGHHPLAEETKNKLELNVRNFIKRLQRLSTAKLQYVRVLEVVKNPDGYYYHYHFLIDMPYIKQNTLSHAWNEVTDGSFRVWVELMKNADNKPVGAVWGRLSKQQKQKNCSEYLTKYLAKPLGDIDLDTYARYVYSSHFVETRVDLACIMGQRSSTSHGLICEKCGCRLSYLGTEPLETEPPPPSC